MYVFYGFITVANLNGGYKIIFILITSMFFIQSIQCEPPYLHTYHQTFTGVARDHECTLYGPDKPLFPPLNASVYSYMPCLFLIFSTWPLHPRYVRQGRKWPFIVCCHDILVNQRLFFKFFLMWLCLTKPSRGSLVRARFL